MHSVFVMPSNWRGGLLLIAPGWVPSSIIKVVIFNKVEICGPREYCLCHNFLHGGPWYLVSAPLLTSGGLIFFSGGTLHWIIIIAMMIIVVLEQLFGVSANVLSSSDAGVRGVLHELFFRKLRLFLLGVAMSWYQPGNGLMILMWMGPFLALNPAQFY